MATTYTVDINGSGDYLSISAAVAAASAGDEIIVLDGVYEEDVVINKAITLLSQNGQWNGVTGVQIVGQNAGASLGTITVTGAGSGAVIGDLDQGFTIIGKDGAPGLEKAAVYLQGNVSNVTIRGNDVVANGDGGLTSEYGATVFNIVIDNNIFSGQTFIGTEPGGEGFGDQFTLANVPRQLVVMGGVATSNITFTNNQITGTAGGINVDGQEQGNSLVTLDVTNSLIDGNEFTGFTNRFGNALRVRRDGTTISDNKFDASASGSDNTASVYHVTANPGPVSGNSFIGTDGSDIIYATAGNDAYDGGDGADTYSFAPGATTGAYADLQSGVAFSGQTGFDTLENIENLAGTNGNDSFFGDAADNTFFASGGNDTVDGRGNGPNGDTFDASSSSADVTINLATGSATGFGGTTTLTNVENATGGSGDDTLVGDAGDNVLTGNGGNDTFQASAGEDTVSGGEGSDKVVFSGDIGDYEIAWEGGVATVTEMANPSNVTTITDVGQLQFADQAVFLVDPASAEYATIQSAVDAAALESGASTILVATGTYQEQVVVDGVDNLTIKSAADADVTILAPADVEPTANSSSNRATNAVVTVTNAENVAIEGITVDGDGVGNTVNGTNANYVGVFYRNASGELLSVDITGIRDAYPGSLTEGGLPNVSGVQRGVGLQVDNDTLMSFTMTGGSISDFQKNAAVFNFADLNVTGVTVTGGGAQGIIAQNGLQALNSTGTIADNVITGIGYAGPSLAYSAGIMGYGNTDLVITDNTVVGANGEDLAAKVVGIYILDFGTPNSGGSVTGNIISHVDLGIAVSGGITPDTIVVENNSVTDLDITDPYMAGVDFYPNAGLATPFDIEGSAQNDYLFGAAGNDTLDGLAGDDVIVGGDGDDTLIGGEGNDTMVGGAGIDTVVLNDTEFSLELLDSSSMVVDADPTTAGDQTGWQVATGTADGTETIEGVEIVVDMNGARTLLVGGGGFASIADALLMATTVGDTILVASGHVEPGPITITVANSGVALVSIDGTAVINGAGVNQGSAVRIEAGVENFALGADGHGFEINAGSGDLAAVYVVGDNSNIFIEGNDVSGGTGHAILAGGGVEDSAIRGNELNGDGPTSVVYINGTASVGNASTNVEISGNQITGGANAGLLVGTEAANSLISGNTFSGEASYAQLEVFGAGATIENNTFSADGDKAIIDAGNAGADADLVDVAATGNTYEPGAVWVENPAPGGEGNVIYTSIQAAIEAALPGATIHIGEGVFKENLLINKEVHLVGEPGAVLSGALMGMIGSYDGLDAAFEALPHPSYTGTVGISLQNDADGSSITGLKLQGFSQAIELGSVSGVKIEDNSFENNVTGIRKGTASQVSDLEILGNDFSHGIHGMNIYGSDAGTFDGVTMNNNHFSAMSEKGIYLEQVSNSTFDGNTFNGVGNYGRVSPPFGGTDGEFGQAIDINLKAKEYSNVTFTDTKITNSGNSNQNGAGDYGDFGAAIGVKIRDDAPDYNGNPASFDGSIVFDGLTIDGTSTGVRVGEPGKNNDGPNVTLTDVTILNAAVGEVDNATDPVNGGTTLVEFSALQENLDAGASIADVDVVGNDRNNVVITGSGDDRFEGGLGDDRFEGGDGIDTAVIADVSAISDVGENWQVTSLTDGQETLIDVEIVEVGGARTLLVGAGGFDSIAAALDEANDGDTIMLAAGLYSENVTISEGVTIIGSDGGDSVVTGAWTILSSEQVHIDGLTFRDDKPVVLSIADNFVALKVLTHSADGHIIENSTFERVPSSYPVPFNPTAFAGSNSQQTHRAIELASVGAGSTISILNNTFTGTNAYTYAGDSWRSGIYSNGGLGTTLIEGNTFENVRSAINADNFTTTVTITDNNFLAAGSAISLGGAGADGSDLSTITANQFGTVDTEFNFQGVPNGVVFDANEAIDGPVGDSGVLIYGSSVGGDTITGTNYADTVIGGGGNDSIDTGEGDDVISGGAGSDTINAGDGADTIVGGADADIMDGGDGDDVFLLNSSSEFATGEEINGGDGFDTILWDAQSYDVLFLTDDVTGIERVEMLGSSDSLLGALHVENSLEIMGNSGDNTIAGTLFADKIDGGEGIDTVEYYMGETITNVDGVWIVGGDELKNVEIVNVEGARTLLVGDGGFANIQDAINAANDGDTILISEGIYAPFSVTEANLTIEAYEGHEVIVQGPLVVPGIYDDMYDYASSGPSVGLTGSTAITVAASGTTLNGLTVQGANIGIGFSGALEDIAITNIKLTDVVTGIYKQPNDQAIDGLTIENVEVEDAYQGIVIEKSVTGGHVTDLTVTGLILNHVSGKGIYSETLMGDTTISDLNFSDVGQFGRGSSFGAPLGGWGAGIDINLKSGIYDGEIVIEDFIFTGVGLSNGGNGVDSHLGGAAITIKGRDDSTTVDVTDLSVIVRNGSIDGTSTGVRQGEPGKPNSAGNVTGPSVTVVNVVITGATVSEIDNVSKSLMIVDAGAADGHDDYYEAGNDDTATGPIRFLGNADDNTFIGGRGNDQFFGDAGADTLTGGEGDDTFTYASMSELLDDTLDGGAGLDTLVFDTDADTDIVLGADTFGMEQVTIAGAAINLDASAVVDGLSLVGNNAANIIVGTQCDDDIDAGAGNDTIRYTPGNGFDVVDGGADLDTLDIDGSAELVAMDYALAGNGSTLEIDLNGGAAGLIDTSNVEKVKITTSAAGSTVTLTGDLAAAGIAGAGSQIQFVGGSGVDIVDASGLTSAAKLVINLGGGDDVFKGGRVDQTVIGGAGIDLMDFSHHTSGVAFNLGTGVMGGAAIGGISTGNSGFEQARGGQGNDVLVGGDGDNTFYASIGDDSINGRGGFDIYSGLGFETGEGFYVSLRDGFSIGSYGVHAISNVEGVYGTIYADFIEGDDGANWIDGGAGADTLAGGLGNDTYVANSLGDVVIEGVGEGYDTVYASRHTVLWDNVEELRLTNGRADTAAPNINGYGNDLDNWLYGNDGNNILDGKVGADHMAGGLGDDTYYIDNDNDVVFEADGEGYDQVFSFKNHFMSDFVEQLTLTGGGHITGFGNDEDNVIIGNTGKNKIVGRGGADTLTGGGNADTFIYKSLSDSVVGNRDTITDFEVGIDKIDIQSVTSQVFNFRGEGASFVADGTAQLTFYEEDGNTIVEGDRNGDGVADLQVELLGIKALTADDFLL